MFIRSVQLYMWFTNVTKKTFIYFNLSYRLASLIRFCHLVSWLKVMMIARVWLTCSICWLLKNHQPSSTIKQWNNIKHKLFTFSILIWNLDAWNLARKRRNNNTIQYTLCTWLTTYNPKKLFIWIFAFLRRKKRKLNYVKWEATDYQFIWLYGSWKNV